MTHSPVWHLADDRAQLTLGTIEAEISISQPGLGLHNFRCRGTSITAAHILAPQLPPRDANDRRPIADCYVRGNDLVVTYAQGPDDPVRLQIYWRAQAPSAVPACVALIDVMVSVQTSRLTSHPALSVVSRLPTREVERLPIVAPVAGAQEVASIESRASADCWACPLRSVGMIYGEMVHPADVTRAELKEAVADQTVIVHHLFPQVLEKGVILRARARGTFAEIAHGTGAIEAAYTQFLASPLPLTA